MDTRIIMPQLGESVVEGTVAEWLKQPGDAVSEYESIVRVSTDKVDTEIPSPAAGILREVLIPAGQTVNAGVTLGIISARNTATPAPHPQPTPPSDHISSGHVRVETSGPHITPVVARMVREHNLDLARISGTGHGGRITKKDVESFLAQQGAVEVPPWEQPGSGDLFKSTSDYEMTTRPAGQPPSAPLPAPPQAAAPAVTGAVPYEIVAISAMRRRIADHMVESKRISPHVTTVFEADLSAVVRHREAQRPTLEAQGIRLTLTAYFVFACARALAAFPLLNARWTVEGIVAYRVAHIGVAAATEEGLIVPVLKNAQDYHLIGLARQIHDLTQRARARQLRPDDVRDGTFTLTNHGVSGSLFATPIINQPQAAILGVGAVEKRVKVIHDAIAIRSCAYLSLTFDHRIADGAYADGFVQHVKATLEGWTSDT